MYNNFREQNQTRPSTSGYSSENDLVLEEENAIFKVSYENIGNWEEKRPMNAAFHYVDNDMREDFMHLVRRGHIDPTEFVNNVIEEAGSSANIRVHRVLEYTGKTPDDMLTSLKRGGYDTTLFKLQYPDAQIVHRTFFESRDHPGQVTYRNGNDHYTFTRKEMNRDFQDLQRRCGK